MMTISQVILTLVRRYSLQYQHVERDDLVQVACEAAIRASRTWKQDGGATLSSYVWNAVNRNLYRYVARAWSPVHAGDRRCAELLATQQVSVDTCQPHETRQRRAHDNAAQDGKRLGAVPLPVPEQAAPEVLLDRVRAFRRLHEVIAQQPDAAVAMEYLLGEATAGEVAAKLGCTVGDVRRIVRSTRDAIRADDTLREAARRL